MATFFAKEYVRASEAGHEHSVPFRVCGQLFFRDPALASLERILFAKRHPFLESHNYSEHLDGILEPGGIRPIG